MNVALADPAEMIRAGAPHLIRTDEELAEYTGALFELTAKLSTSAEEDEAVDLLTWLIERYEQAQYPVPSTSPVAVLRYLMDRQQLKGKDLVQEFGAESTVSLVLSGKRQMTRDHIARLSTRFHVSPAVFFAA